MVVDGILVIDKPQDWTSHDVVAKVRKLTRIRRVGHTGTLDPMATGVLLLCLGKATRVVEYIVGHDKSYRATVQLGAETDTYDAQGQVVARKPVDVSEEALRTALDRFKGKIQQVPPMYSALKRDGKKLVDLARKGIEVKREPRPVTVYKLDLLSFDVAKHAFTIDMRCSSGTYVRSLAYDLGRTLGCGAHLAALTRTAVGDVELAQALSLEDFEDAVKDGSWTSLLRPLDSALEHFPSITLSDEDAVRARHGGMLDVQNFRHSGRVRAYDSSGMLISIMRFDPVRKKLRPEKVLAAQ